MTELELNVEAAICKVRMAADNLCALWPIVKPGTIFVDKGYATTSLSWGGGFVFIECSTQAHDSEPMMKFETKYLQLQEQEVAEIFGILMRR